MDTKVLARQLKVYCPTHQTVFEVEEKPQIVCEIREHALSNNFPKEEFWEYCCDCQIFSPSSFGSGGKAAENCRHCERQTLRRFLCDECKIVTYESDEDTKGKNFTISPEGTKPACPGCRKTFGEIHSNQHQCADIEGALMTHRAECPFCRKSTFAKASSPKQVEPFPDNVEPPSATGKMPSTQCPKCGNWGFAGRIHCGKCGVQLNASAEGVSPGTTTARTQLLGSICPNCGTGNQAGSYFCNSCGQALKVAQTAPAETAAKTVNLPPPIPITPTNTATFGAQTIPPNDSQPKPSFVEQNKPLLAIMGSLLVFVFIIGIITFSTNKSSSNTNVKSPSPSPSSTKSTASKTSTPMNRTEDNTATSSPLIGRKGTLKTNAFIRSTPGKDGEMRGTHYQGAKLEILEVSSFYNDKGEYVTWFRVNILENGYDQKNGNGRGNNWERDGTFGWLEAETEGWIYADTILLN